MASEAARGVSAGGVGGGSSLGYAIGVPSRFQLAPPTICRSSATKEPRVVPDGLRMLILRKAEEGRRASASADMGAPSSAEEGHTAAGAGAPLEIVHKALASVKNLGNWTYEVHQYFDYYR